MATNKRLKAARVGLGLTQLQLAEKIGVKEIEVSRLETGRAQPTAQIKQLMVEALQKPAHELFDA